MAVGLEANFLAVANNRVHTENVTVLNAAQSENIAGGGTLLVASGGELEGAGNSVLIRTEINRKVARGHFAFDHNLVSGAEAAISGEGPWHFLETVLDFGQSAIERKRFTSATHVVVLGPEND